MPLNEILKFFAAYIEKELGIIYAEHNFFQLHNRLEEIAKLKGVAGIEQLYDILKDGMSGQTKQLLLDLATNNETSFFRDPKIFRAIESIFLNNLDEVVGEGGNLRIWSAASSTGQEALSVAILINEFSAKNNKNVAFSIVGTDISERVLIRAKQAEYSQLEVQRGLPVPFLIKYFKKDEKDRWTAMPEITKNIEFKKQNLKEAFNFKEKFHLILCRNVLIYQNVPAKIEILNRMTSLLAPGGLLILGSGESLIGLSTEFDQQNMDGAIIYKKRDLTLKSAA
ncbi:MAG: CheR family methyltransferase [Bdellovibrio sp.]